jgi:hypothetical protein
LPIELDVNKTQDRNVTSAYDFRNVRKLEMDGKKS